MQDSRKRGTQKVKYSSKILVVKKDSKVFCVSARFVLFAFISYVRQEVNNSTKNIVSRRRKKMGIHRTRHWNHRQRFRVIKHAQQVLLPRPDPEARLSSDYHWKLVRRQINLNLLSKVSVQYKHFCSYLKQTFWNLFSFRFVSFRDRNSNEQDWSRQRTFAQSQEGTVENRIFAECKPQTGWVSAVN